MSEADLWTTTRKAIGHTGHFTRVENAVAAGMPDVDFCIRGIEGRLELKHRADEPARIETPVFKHKGLRESQLLWIRTRVKHGGRVFILAEVAGSRWLLPGSVADDFNDMTLFEIGKASIWGHPPRRPDWPGLVEALIS